MDSTLLRGLSLSFAIAALPPGGTPVWTVAGSGEAGIADGPAASASFLMPSAVARANDGTLYVADEAAQRIRAVHPDGSVETVAGSGAIAPDGLSVPGGYRDGPAATAQFYRPDGVAVGPDGAVYVSDNRNWCIRKLDRGVVSTFAGTCGQSGVADGPATTARFKDPRALVFGPEGTLYVADFGAGIRTVSASGAVGTLKFGSTPDVRFWGIGYAPGADAVLLASTPGAVVAYHVATRADEAFSTNAVAEASLPFGSVGAIAGLDHREFLFTDLRANNVRYLRLPLRPFAPSIFTRTIAGGRFERQVDDAGYRNGSLEESRFYAPRGIAVANGTAYVADAGNRRIRALTLPRFRLSEGGFTDAAPYDASAYQMLYLGASWAYHDSLGDDSICAHVEAELDASRKFSKPVRCHPVRIDSATFPQLEDYLANYLQPHVDVVVVNLSLSIVFGIFPNRTPPSTDVAVATFKTRVAALRERLAKNGTRLVLLWTNAPDDVSDVENLYGRESVADQRHLPADLADNYTHGTKLMIDAAATVPVDQVDTYEDFLRAERAVPPQELFGTDDVHMTPAGSALTAHLLARYLISRPAP